MSKPTLQVYYLIVSFIMVIGLLFYGASQLLAFYQSGSDDKPTMLIDTESINSYYQPKITWITPIENEGRVMDDNALEKISRDYVASYYHQFRALKTGNIAGLHDYYTEKSRTHLEELVDWHKDQNQSISGTTIEHQTQLHFYSEDGTIASLEDRVVTYQKTIIEGTTRSINYDTSRYQVMLLLEDNFWRIRHKVRVDDPKSDTQSVSPSRNFIQENDIYTDSSLFKIKGINYYPQDHPWELMWEHFEEIDLQSDFNRISQSGFNTIRIFVPFQHFGGAQVKESELAKLVSLMNHANNADLKVIVTLFDFFLGYPLEEWTLSDRHAETIIETLKNHPALLAWDIKNEPDLDFEQSGKTEVLEWLNFISQRIKNYDPSTFITIGWSQPEESLWLEENVDFYSFHFYRDPSELESFLKENILNKPAFLGETGMHSFKSWWYPIGNTEEDQKAYYSQITQLIQSYGLNYAFWTLYDFPQVPPNVAGKWPWQRRPQKRYGLINADGKTKESFDLVKSFNKETND